MIGALSFGLVMNSALDLANLPSPSSVEDTVRSKVLNSYQVKLKRTKSFLLEFSKLSPDSKNRLVADWFSTTAEARKNARNELQPSTINESGCRVSLEQDKFDLTKIDLLRVNDGKEPIFHTRFWLECLYKANEKFTIPDQPSRLPSMFTSYSGRLREPGLPSFDPFFDSESATVAAWVQSKFSEDLVKPMTLKRMVEKLDSKLTSH